MSTRKKILKGINSVTKHIGLDFYYWLHKYSTYWNIERNFGHAKSIKTKQSIDKAGNFVPWFTYPAIHFLNTKNLEQKSVFEWGGGASSKYFSKKCKDIITIEDNTEWFKFLETNKFSNQTLFLEPTKDGYTNAIKNFDKNFDIIIVDGSHREECLRIGSEKLNPMGFLILDNSDWYQDDVAWLEAKGLYHIPFQGFAPINDYISVTSFFINIKPGII